MFYLVKIKDFDSMKLFMLVTHSATVDDALVDALNELKGQVGDNIRHKIEDIGADDYWQLTGQPTYFIEAKDPPAILITIREIDGRE